MLNLLQVLFATAVFGQTNHFGFANGNRLNAVPIQGEVHVTCSGFNGESATVYNCRDIILEPGAYDHFKGPQGDFQWVDLVSEWTEGSVRVKTAAYDGKSGSTNEPLNLWISTLFQKGLLAIGSNEVSYKLYKKNNTSEQGLSGKFTAIVERVSERLCPQGQYDSTDANDCSSQYSVCQRYFAEQKFCK